MQAKNIMNVTIAISIPGHPVHHHSISTDMAKAEAKKQQQLRDGAAAAGAAGGAATSTAAPPTKKRKTETNQSDGQVASSVADRASGPGVDPTSRFSYVYTGKHDHGPMESESVRRDHQKWSGLSDAMTHMKRHCDTHLTKIMNSEGSSSSSSSSSSSKT